MTIHLDHIIVPARDKVASAKLLAHLLNVRWSEKAEIGPFTPVFINDGLTFDFDQHDQPFAPQHYCFRVSEAEFDAIFERLKAAEIPYRSGPQNTVDMKINTAHGGRLVYWGEPDGHVWEMLTVSYAR